MDLIVALPILIALLVLKGFFSGSEIALVNADKVKLRHRAKNGDKGAGLVLKAFRRPDELLSTTLIGTNLATIALTTIGTLVIVDLVGPSGDLYAFLILTPLLLVLGEIVPKSVMQQTADKITPIVIHPLLWFRLIIYPIILIFSGIARMAAKLAGGASDSGLFMTREQLSAMVDMAGKSSQFAAFGEGRIRTVMRFAQSSVGEVMIPMAEVVAANIEYGLDDAIKRANAAQVTRVPVYRAVASNVIGIAHLQPWDVMDPDFTARPLDEIMTLPLFVSPYQSVQELIPELATRADRMAVVVDEYGSATGIVLLEDIISQVVGDVNVGYAHGHAAPNPHEHHVERVSDSEYLFDARFGLSEASELLGIALPAQDFHTIGGFVTGRLRHIGHVGDAITEQGWRFTVEEATERAPDRIRVEALL